MKIFKIALPKELRFFYMTDFCSSIIYFLKKGKFVVVNTAIENVFFKIKAFWDKQNLFV